MNKTSLVENLVYGENKPNVTMVLETEFSKEIRIVFQKGQEMKEHKTAFPIIVEIFEGEIVFGVENEEYKLVKGDLVTLPASIPHHLVANENSIVRLTLSKFDTAERVQDVANKSI
ncbi:cupin domain-containing protein [Aureivirga sp. CE67]|uniref:cupin domain-containing protein n=1 Tax=Aureivirga sp. CE67 TaxID=1788983 RepID=UPI0018C94374|nr:cupin domain-containing protein [Aureivirga sp. CE67]